MSKPAKYEDYVIDGKLVAKPEPAVERGQKRHLRSCKTSNIKTKEPEALGHHFGR
jgi:hypothetical protein